MGAGSLMIKIYFLKKCRGAAHRLSTQEKYKKKVIQDADYTKGLGVKEKEIRAAHSECFKKK